MYYDRLRERVRATAALREAQAGGSVPLVDCIAPAYRPLHEDIQQGKHQIYHLPGGRGSCKSSFVSLEIVSGMMGDQSANAIVFRRVAGTMRESVFAQIAWAIDTLGVTALWRGSVSPMQFTFKPTGQQIIFRGLDDVGKLKSIKPRSGVFRYVWFEEFSELPGENAVRSVLQSVVRGGDDFFIFNSFNPPLSVNNWANKYILIPDNRAIVFRTTYKDVPAEWLGEAFVLEAERLQAVNETAYRHEYLGEATGSGGEVFPNIVTEEITDEAVDQMQYIFCGVDFGFATDPAAVIRVSYDAKKQTIYFLDELYKRNCSNADLYAAITEKKLDATGRTEYLPFERCSFPVEQTFICDSAEPKSIADLRNMGLKVLACKKYPGSVLYGIRWLQSKTLVFDPRRTPHAYREFSQYEYLTTKDGEFLADVPDKDNHLIDSTRYALDRIINNSRYSA